MKRYLTARAAAAALGVDHRTIARAVKRGELIPDCVHEDVNGTPVSYGFHASTVRAWVDEHYRPEMKR